MRLGQRLLSPDREEEDGGESKADRIEQHRDGRAESTDDGAGRARTGELRRGTADLELRVPVDELVALDERRQVRLVRDVEEDGADPDQEGDDVQMAEGERVEEVGERNRAEQRRPAEVADDEDRLPPEPVDPHASRKREEDERQELDDEERGDGEGARVEKDDGNEGERELRELRAEDADRLGRPELEEVRLAPQAPLGPEPAHQRRSAR